MTPEEICRNTFSKQLPKNPRYPDDRVVAHTMRFLYSSPSRYRQLKALDIGCGLGRHMSLLYNLGFDVFGIDYADNVVDCVMECFPYLPPSNIYMGDYRSVTFPVLFDLIVAWGVVFCCIKSELLLNLESIYRKLDLGGQLIVNFRTFDNWFYGLGKAVENDSFILDKQAEDYAGYLYSFYTDLEVEQIAQQIGFTITDKEKLELFEYKHNSERKHSWLIYRLSK